MLPILCCYFVFWVIVHAWSNEGQMLHIPYYSKIQSRYHWQYKARNTCNIHIIDILKCDKLRNKNFLVCVYAVCESKEPIPNPSSMENIFSSEGVKKGPGRLFSSSYKCETSEIKFFQDLIWKNSWRTLFEVKDSFLSHQGVGYEYSSFHLIWLEI